MRAPVIVLGLAAFALTAALSLAQQGNPFTANESAIAAGAAIYDTACAGCHGPQGTGGTAPPLNRNLVRGTDDAALFAIIHDGIADTQMPAFPALSQDNIWRIAAYVRSLNTLAPQPLAMADAMAGEALFFGDGKCAACHEVNGRGSALATDLSAAGSRPAIELRNALAHQPLNMRFVTVVNQQGQRSSGFIAAQDLFTLHLRQTDGSLRVLPKTGLRVTAADNPLDIPLLDDRQTDDILAFLATRNGRDLAQAAKQPTAPVLPYARIATAEARNWATARGSLDGAHFTPLSAITPANVAQLQARWSAQLGDGAGRVTPLVVDGILYAASAAGTVQALDAANGLPVWRHAPQRPETVTGLALLDGRLFSGGGNRLTALNAQTGRTLWRTDSGSAPLALRTRVIAGMDGDGQTAKGALMALDPANGEPMWRLETTASKAFGGLTSVVGAYEAQTMTLYWSTTRTTDDSGDGDSILAVNANSGAVTWRHKLAKGAGGDGVVIYDQTAGTKAALLLHLGRDGLLTVLDRASGKVVRTQSLTKMRVETPSLSFDRSSLVAAAALGAEVAAVDLRSNRVLWRTDMGGPVAGVLATRGGVVFATLSDGQIVALADGKPLWRFRAGGPITTAPVSYAVGTRQFIAVTAGDMVYAFALPS